MSSTEDMTVLSDSSTVIRAARPEDAAGMMLVVEAIDLFGPAELEEMRALVHGCCDGTVGEGQRWIVADSLAGSIAAVAFYAPERMTEGTWNVYFLAVSPAAQGTGLGRAMLRYVEDELRAEKQRILLVETSGQPGFEAQRSFYLRCGYEHEARIRDFYRDGDDKIVFRKALQTRP